MTKVDGLPVFSFGVTEYSMGIEFQNELHSAVRRGVLAGGLICLQHAPVITLGKNSNAKYLLESTEGLIEQGIDFQTTERGGEVTAHEPGQLVVYPILNLEIFKLTPKKYVQLLENTIIAVLKSFGIHSNTDPQHPGVWVGKDKICALGIRIKQKVTMHGLALNVSNDLKVFSKIVACGISDRGVTSIEKVCRQEVSLSEVAQECLQQFAVALNVKLFPGVFTEVISYDGNLDNRPLNP